MTRRRCLYKNASHSTRHYAEQLRVRGQAGRHFLVRALHNRPLHIIGQNANDLPHGAACLCRCIDCLGEQMESGAEGGEVVEHLYQVAETAAQPVELPQDERVAVLPLFSGGRGWAWIWI